MLNMRRLPAIISRRALIVTASAQAFFGFGVIRRAFAQNEPNRIDPEFAVAMLAAVGEPAVSLARKRGFGVKTITVALTTKVQPEGFTARAECTATVEQTPSGPVIVINCP
jgi:hypothetical protein